MTEDQTPQIELIEIDRITIINPRVRNQKSFEDIVANIALVGLKKPITVTRREGLDGAGYDLVCGQGRLEAFKALGEIKIPALVVHAEPEDCLVASLVENVARRQHRAIDLLYDIGGMKGRGYTDTEIAAKTGLSYDYVHGINRLLDRGEQRLLRAVEAGKIPVSVAIDIAESPDHEVQTAFQHAYENNLLRGKSLAVARRLVEQRRRLGRKLRTHSEIDGGALTPTSSESLIRAYREDVDRKRMLISKSDIARSRLHFIIEALRSLLADGEMVILMREQGFDDLPRPIADRLDPREPAYT